MEESNVIKFEKSPQQGDVRLSGPQSGQGVGSGARTRDRRVPADLRADSQATVLPTPQSMMRKIFNSNQTGAPSFSPVLPALTTTQPPPYRRSPPPLPFFSPPFFSDSREE
ncbi:hypothetical protein PoB_005309800 [Plakobranchus ocellatus]|uniref:Uncharacterized protein n=1 Tax=Plakobranchus ocellatus TaxID=259542 RepID=A0AAV4C6H7_9GAST|nr:hypothetical protein PoB_005309800 [Plakobranchus ocellatus]